MKDIVLPNTSLCAIIRDEKMNPAGGIMRFLRSVMPHVEQGVIVDTGSEDGTRELLAEGQKQFPHLEVYDAEFKGYAQARNVSLSHVKTPWVLVLDADEALVQEDYNRLARSIGNGGYEGFDFKCMRIAPDCDERAFCLNPRLFRTQEFRGYEIIRGNGWHNEVPVRWVKTHPESNITLYHFETSGGFDLKMKFWYCSPDKGNSAPSTVPEFKEWKKFNPKRNNYRASGLDNPETPAESEVSSVIS